MRYNRLFLYILCCLGLVLTIDCQVAAQERRPLLQEGKKSLYQRVVSHPGAALYDVSGPQSQKIKNIKTFTVFYVYGQDNDRLEIGVTDHRADGWIDASKATFWNQALTMVFTGRSGREPVLFFRDHNALESTCTDENLSQKIRQYRALLSESKTPPPDYPVIAIEPAAKSVSEKNFYLLPVLDVDTSFVESGTKLVEIASIDPGISGTEDNSPPATVTQLRSGLVFVIDTTISMKPYIDQTLKLVQTIYDELEKNPHGDKISIAVVAFRNSTSRTPNIQYLAKVVSDFKNVKQRAELEKALAQVEEATVATHSFDEDSFAGVKMAVDSLSWDSFGSRIMLLLTDAGPLSAGDKDSGTQMSAEVLADYLKSNRIYLTVAHIKSPAGGKNNNHAKAEKAYRTLSMQSDNQSSYLALDASTPAKGAAAFDSVGRTLARGYDKLVTATAEGKMLPAPQKAKSVKAATPEEEAARIAESTGYAMQLQFFGNRDDARAPSVVKAWVADADLEKLADNPQAQPVLAIEPALLVSKTQLSQLREQLKAILEKARQSLINDTTQNFFQSILSAAAQMTRDPNSFVNSPAKNLAQAGVMGEFLDGLPYKSRLMNLTEEDWASLSLGEQNEIINHIEARIRRYEEYDRDNKNWEGFGAADRSEWVYRVPLSMLP
ncbi:MAG: VWA domain-containing protein [Desulfovibrio sp.]|jgi:serine/threonine-protein kinase PpkA|nr:VWA domain-containing protein [Desulfovibrio sp.]